MGNPAGSLEEYGNENVACTALTEHQQAWEKLLVGRTIKSLSWKNEKAVEYFTLDNGQEIFVHGEDPMTAVVVDGCGAQCEHANGGN